MADNKLNTVELPDYKGGVNYSKDLLSLAGNESPNALNMEFMDGDLIRKRKGYKEVNAVSVGEVQTHSVYDFGISAINRQLIYHAGDCLYNMNGLNGEFELLKANVQDVQSNVSEIKQLLVISFIDGSTPLYWNGIDAVAILSPYAPGFSYTIEHQGFLLGANTPEDKLRVYYEDINTMVGGDYDDYFTITGGLDDEVTSWFKLNGILYAGTKAGIFRVSYIGGVAVFEYKLIISNAGIVPRTAQTVVNSELGQVVIFLGYDLQVYLFDGTRVRAISDKFKKANNDTVIALDYIDKDEINNSSSVYDITNQVYRLVVTVKGREKNSYIININVDDFSYYPYDNMTFHEITIAKDAIGQRFLIGGDYAGKVHKLFGNYNSDNGIAIVEFYEGPPLASNLANAKTAKALDFYFNPVANYKLKLEDRTDFDKTWKHRTYLKMYDTRDRFLGQNTMLGTSAKLGSDVSVAAPSVNIPVVSNVYRYRLHTDGAAGTICSYETGTVSATGGTTTVTGTNTVWDPMMTSNNGYKIWIDSGEHANTAYDFDYVSATEGTVSALGAEDISDAVYQIYKTGDAACALGWELIRADYNTVISTINKASTRRG